MNLMQGFKLPKIRIETIIQRKKITIIFSLDITNTYDIVRCYFLFLGWNTLWKKFLKNIFLFLLFYFHKQIKFLLNLIFLFSPLLRSPHTNSFVFFSSDETNRFFFFHLWSLEYHWIEITLSDILLKCSIDL